MNPEEIKNRTDTLSQACLKVALLMKVNTEVDGHAKAELVKHASDMAIKSRSLMVAQAGRYFADRLNAAAENAMGCAYWLEHIALQGLLDAGIAKPLISESEQMYKIFLLSAKKAADKMNME